MNLVKLATSCCLVAAACAFSPQAEAAYTMTVSQSGSNVVASGSGSINTAGLTNSGSANWSANVAPSFPGEISVGPTSSVTTTHWTGISGPAGFGSGPQVFADSGTGTLVAVLANNGFELPSTYVSGSVVTGTATWNAQTIAGLGLTTGTYTWTWGTGPTADSFTLMIGSAPVPSTPVPSSLYLVTLGILALALLQVFRMRRAA